MKADKNKQNFLLTFFTQTLNEHYEEKEVNGYWLVKTFNGDTGIWQVSIFTKESLKIYQEFRKNSV